MVGSCLTEAILGPLHSLAIRAQDSGYRCMGESEPTAHKPFHKPNCNPIHRDLHIEPHTADSRAVPYTQITHTAPLTQQACATSMQRTQGFSLHGVPSTLYPSADPSGDPQKYLRLTE